MGALPLSIFMTIIGENLILGLENVCFVGYAPTQKGYKCFDPISKKLFVTMDVTFFESKPFFATHLQGESTSEDSDIV